MSEPDPDMDVGTGVIKAPASGRGGTSRPEGTQQGSDFLATLAHELRNPLAPLRTGLEILKLARDPELVAETVDMMERQLLQMVGMVDDLLDLSHLREGRLDLQRRRINLRCVIDEALEASRATIDAAEHRVSLDLPPTPLFVQADATRLAQVFARLLEHAARCSERGGELHLTAALEGEEIVVRLRDNGAGTPAEMQPCPSGPFARGRRGGIGLSLARQLVELHGGRISGCSAGEGQGTEFSVRLKQAPPWGPELAETSGAALPDGAQPRRILLADDHADSAASMSMMLRILGHEVATAGRGDEAVGLVERFHPDVVILDIGMPVMDGYEACRQMRRRPGGEALHIVALTGWGQDEDRSKSRAAGFDHHLVKPVAPDDLVRLLDSL